MSEVIQCPSCSKKFRLPENPPAQFTCTSCGTLMDLSAFGGTAAPVAPAASAGRSASAGGGGAPSSRKRRAGSRSASRGRARAGARGHDDGYDDGPRGRGGRGRPQKQNSNALLWGSLVGLLAIVGIAIAVMGGDDEKPAEETTASTNAGTNTPPANSTPTGTTPASTTPANPAPAGTQPASPPAGTTPAAPSGTTPAAPPPNTTKPAEPTPNPRRTGRIRMSDIELRIVEWPEDVGEDVRSQAETHVAALINGGRESREAEAWFIEQGNKVAPALISEFKRRVDANGMESKSAMGDLMVIDRMLFKMDGFPARKWNSTETITHASSPSFAMARMKRWVAWWDNGYWREPVKPWDPRFDEIDPDAPKPKDDEVGRDFGGGGGE